MRKNNRPKKGSIIEVDPIRNLKDIKTIKKLLAGKPRDFFLFVLTINTGLRITDILCLKIKDLKYLNVGHKLKIIERKTGKKNFIYMNKAICSAMVTYLEESNPHDEDYIFKSRKGKNNPLGMIAINHMVKRWTSQINLNSGNYGARSLRKTWGYQQRKIHGTPIELIQKRFNHKSSSTTMRYLGIEKEEIQEILSYEI